MSGTNSNSTDARKLRAKLDEWRERLDGDDRLAIWKQISAMLWRSAFYRSINESRKYLPQGEDGTTLANGALHELIHEGYITIHAVEVRRLIDGRGGTNSLINLIKDVKKHASLLSRKNMLDARGLVYDFEPIKEQARFNAYHEAKKQGKDGYFVSGDGWREAECWHNNCDLLCGTVPSNRRPSDQPKAKRFLDLMDDLRKVGRAVEEYVNNNIAHAALPERRELLLPEYQSVSLVKLWKAERAIVRVAGFISRCIVTGIECGNVPVPQFDQFKHLDRPFANSGAIAAMNEAWKLHSCETSECSSWDWNQSLGDDPRKPRSPS